MNHCANPYLYFFSFDPSSSRYQTTLQHTYSQLPQEEPWGAGMTGCTILRLPLQHTHVSCPNINLTSCLLLKAQLQLIHQCSFLIYISLERGVCGLCKSRESSSSLLLPLFGIGVVLGSAENVHPPCKANSLPTGLPTTGFMAEAAQAAAALSGRSLWLRMGWWCERW